MDFLNRRKEYRAPLRTYVLYQDLGYIFKARLLNISNTGLLLENLPHIPKDSHVHALVDIPRLPILEPLSDDDLFGLDYKGLSHKVFPVELEVVRKKQDRASVDEYFVQMGCIVSYKDPSSQKFVEQYVKGFQTNFRYLEKEVKNSSDDVGIKRIFKVAELLGYRKQQNIESLSRAIDHDSKGLFYF